MTDKEIKEYEQVMIMKQGIIKENSLYAYGKNVGILTAPDTAKPDIRIPAPLGKSAITDVVGLAGRSDALKTDYFKKTEDEEGEEDDLTTIIKSFDLYNQEGIENSELLKKSLSIGIAWELWWTSKELDLPNAMMTPEYKILDNIECVPVFDGMLKPKLDKFLRFWEDKDKNKRCDVYQPKTNEHYIKAKDADDWMPATPAITNHPYTRTPVIPFRTSTENTPLFEAEKPLIDAFDKVISRTQSEIERFAALTTLFPGVADKAFRTKLSEALEPFIDNLDEYDVNQWPKYLQKDYSGIVEFYKNQGKTLKDLFHETIKVPNFMDENFAGDSTGIALSYKLIGLEFLVSEIETYFRPGLAERFLMYQDIINASTMKVNWDDYEQRITWHRNLPVDAEVKVKIATMLQGLGYSQVAIDRYMPDSIIQESLVTEVEEDEETIGGIIALDGQITDTAEALKLSGIQIKSANEIISKVAAGILTREAGINQLMIFLGLTLEQANKVMGAQ